MRCLRRWTASQLCLTPSLNALHKVGADYDFMKETTTNKIRDTVTEAKRMYNVQSVPNYASIEFEPPAPSTCALAAAATSVRRASSGLRSIHVAISWDILAL